MMDQGFIRFLTFLLILAGSASAQVSTPLCRFSCPVSDTLSQPLVKRPNAIGYGSFYSIFECIYTTSKSKSGIHKCSYDKTSGAMRLGSVDDNCPVNAVPCTEGGLKQPMFSDQEKDETPPWVESGRYLLYLKEHPPSAA